MSQSTISFNDYIYTNCPQKSQEKYQDRGLTTSISGYCYEMRHLVNRHMANHTVNPYTHWATVRFDYDWDIDTVKQVWTKTTRYLRSKKLSHWWVRELNENSRVHYHLIFRAPQESTKSLKAHLEAATKAYTGATQVKPIDTVRIINLFNYLTKGKRKGIVEGREIDDIYKNKRRIFKPKLDLDKHGSSRNFWEKRGDERFKNLKHQNKLIWIYLDKPDVVREAKDLYDMFNNTICAKKLQRICAYQHWQTTLKKKFACKKFVRTI